jgi:hypothetical protein
MTNQPERIAVIAGDIIQQRVEANVNLVLKSIGDYSICD